MNVLIESLRAYGADVNGALARFLGDEELYVSCLSDFLEDPCFAELGHALRAGDYARAFDCAHTLKGVAGNMGLSPLYQAVSVLVESLRSKEYADLPAQYHEVTLQHDELKQMGR